MSHHCAQCIDWLMSIVGLQIDDWTENTSITLPCCSRPPLTDRRKHVRSSKPLPTWKITEDLLIAQRVRDFPPHPYSSTICNTSSLGLMAHSVYQVFQLVSAPHRSHTLLPGGSATDHWAQWKELGCVNSLSGTYKWPTLTAFL